MRTRQPRKSRHGHALWLAIAALMYLIAPTAAKAANYTLCVGLDTSLENVNVGEDYLIDADGPYVGRYLKAAVFRNNVLIVGATYLNSAGCLTFSNANLGPFTMNVVSEMRVPRTDNAAQTNTAKIQDNTGVLAGWSFQHTFVSGGTTSKTFYAAASWATNLTVVTRQSLERLSNGLSSKATLYITPAHNPRKYAIAHELGHAVVAHWFATNPWPQNASEVYDFNGGGVGCTWGGAGAHALHSMEYAAAGVIEGFPQFYATYAFNNETQTEASFYYYKDGTGVTDVNMETGPVGGSTAFMTTDCSGVKTGKGNELDWARQFWDYRTNAGTKPSNNAILSQMFTAYNNPNVWFTAENEPNNGDFDNSVNRLTSSIGSYDAANQTAFATRWGSTDDTNGINYPDP